MRLAVLDVFRDVINDAAPRTPNASESEVAQMLACDVLFGKQLRDHVQHGVVSRVVLANSHQCSFFPAIFGHSVLILALLLSGCAHAIQPIAKDYTVPQQWARIGCKPRGDMFNGLPVLTCPDGLRIVDKDGALMEFVPLEKRLAETK